ncbi:MAG: glycerol-3-phosphate 1-O-acyltransferase PlsY [Kurthia gibsonii]|uniref:Glycerol-3-phosphate acyltransferase n=1 Tax=Kurthia gibsonii TaxID=33946 RepID=A0ABU9LJP7_9BACL|nr:MULTISPECIES: glycerol-3-phosphate 1-O-acyltransferase PlsY [Kurthia]MCA9725252.1 glycerol-3-phosphate 1-O-acyltransferase PlsY [Kurthia sp.]AMA62860.1 acyl-phosphate glycerol 3-phosphate acyltransferase [Kurthia sp. 11kri321]MEB6112296.1 glycerol-3-phosphate 1-O-acyltransferase PlsY [Kurthia gibsonii]RXH51931.1 glycerol-3-phosphate 1-O-acyltransferase PlsY [Kurthia gibsonii]WIL40030.1 glycerol-3-phosphate 1-O-acyltransferase PlsY [Kurthia sp. YJT4]
MNTAIVIILAYLIGSIPSGLWIGQLFYKTDIRQHGSGNLGATNTFRVLGKKAGAVVTVMDILKGTLATLLPTFAILSNSHVHPLVAGVIAVVGHMFPIFAKFRGGKAVATSAGVLLGYHWPIFVILLIAFLLCLKAFKMVSLASMFAAVVAFIYGLTYAVLDQEYLLFAVVTALATFVIYRHRANIKRIKEGTEPKVTWI